MKKEKKIMNDEYIQAQGNIFSNDYKKNKNHPDKRGKIVFPKKLVREMANTFVDDSSAEEVELNVAIWERTSRKQNKKGGYTEYLFTRIEMPRERVNKEEAKKVAENVATSEADDEIPF
tara:strand:- start:819 stop:1175 length:357 start_codon:yes stop_codon:yes gene_type:complete